MVKAVPATGGVILRLLVDRLWNARPFKTYYKLEKC